VLKFFSSSATNKVDAKGRVSIPAPFRKVLQGEGSSVLVLVPEITGRPVVEGFGEAHFAKLAASLEEMNPYSPEYDALANVVFGAAHQLPLDDTGRIILPQEFRDLTGITDMAQFVGRANTFQIWNPETYQAGMAEMRETARANVHKLPWAGGRTNRGEP
jgi:MraZ protein